MTIDIPPEAKRLYNDAVLMIQENLTQRRASHDNSEVIDSLKSAVREFPKFFEAWRLLGEMCLSTEQVLLGYLALRRAWDLQSDDPAVATLLAEAALMLDRPGLALDYLEKMKTGEEASPVVKKLTARALAKAEMWEEALRSFGDALAEDPSDGNTRRDCAEILSNLNYPKDAANILADYLDPFREFIDNQPAIVETDWIMHPGAVLDRLEAGARKKASRTPSWTAKNSRLRSSVIEGL